MRIPRVIIAGTNSGCGKTTITTGIMAALCKRGFKVQPFKVGPDYIDPMFHTYITGRYSRNLDSWMLEQDVVQSLLVKSSRDADISIIEGVMGLYDGFGGRNEAGSTAHVSKITKSPVVLVVNGEGMSLSIAALIHGYIDFDREVDIRGVIINNINSEAHYQLLKQIIEDNMDIEVIGYLPKVEECSLESRHLGLVPSVEIEGLKDKISLLADKIERTVNLEAVLRLTDKAQDLTAPGYVIPPATKKVRIGVARDKAFNFYYKDNLELLEMLGAELVFFSPLNDKKLPDDIDGLYIGGGYPEVWGKDLEKNVSIRGDIKEKITRGIPTYAECGGLMYMSESIKDRDGQVYEMVGVIPGKSQMTSSLKRFGYVNIEITDDNILARKGSKIRGHEFHYSVTEVRSYVPACYNVVKKKMSGKSLCWRCGYKMHNLLAAYPHIHFWSNTEFARGFINSCIKWAENGACLD